MTTSGSVTKIKIGNNLYSIGVEGHALSGVKPEGEGNVVSSLKYDSSSNEVIFVLSKVEPKLVLSDSDPECLELR